MRKLFMEDWLIRFYSQIDINRTKMKFNVPNSYGDPAMLYKQNPALIDNDWLFWREFQKNFEVGDIAINLVRLPDGRWLLTTIKIVVFDKDVQDDVNYLGSTIADYEWAFGRAIFKYPKSYRKGVTYLAPIVGQLEFSECLPEVYH